MPMAGSNGGGVQPLAPSSTPSSHPPPNNPPPNAPLPVLPTPKTWELSEYELNRVPQEAVVDGSEIAVSPRALHSELMCPICLDMLHNTMTTKECLHRFCSECIITALRSGNKECPTCRKKLVSKRSLRHDPNFDQLISKIYPSRDEYEAQQQKAMARLSKSHNQLALASSIEEGMRAQAIAQLRKSKTNKGGDENFNESTVETSPTNGNAPVQATLNNNNIGGANVTPGLNSATQVVVPTPSNTTVSLSGVNTTTGGKTPSGLFGPQQSLAKMSRTESGAPDNSSNTSGYSEEVTEVELVFKPHPDMINSKSPNSAATVQNQTRFIKTTANASVEHLAKYLGMRLALDSEVDAEKLHSCTIYVSPSGGGFTIVPSNQTLSQVCEKHWRVNKPLEMYYSWKKI